MSRPLRICLIASARFPIAEPFMGGLEAHTHVLARALRSCGHHVSLFAAPGTDPGLDATRLPVAAFTSSPAARADVGAPPDQWMTEHHAYLDLMLALAEGRHGSFDVVHDNSLHHLPLAMSRTVDAPMVTTLHTPPVAWIESAARLAAPHVAYVAVSRTVAQAWSHALSASVIPNGVDCATWRPGPGGPDAVWFGRLVPEKAPHLAIDAARSAGLAIDLAGPRHDPVYFEAEVRPRLGSDVRYRGHLRGAALHRLVGDAAVTLVTPRWPEPFGLVAAESMACGTPVAAWSTGAMADVVALAGGCLADPEDVDGLGEAALRAATLDRASVRRVAEERFSHDRMIEGYVRLYRGLATGVAAA